MSTSLSFELVDILICFISERGIHLSFIPVHATFIISSKSGMKQSCQDIVKLMSYDYTSSCRTFIAPHDVRHDNLIKTALQKEIFLLSISHFLKSCSQLVGTTRRLHSAGYAFKCLPHFRCLFAYRQGTYTLQVSVAAT